MDLRQRMARTLHDLPLDVHQAVPPPVRRELRHLLGRFYPWESGYDHHNTPTLLDGEVNGPPDFVGIGVQKAGTSWWHKLILDHPGVSARRAIHKEHHYFTQYGIRSFGPGDVADYRSWFPRRIGGISGEWTPTYFDCPWAPELLHQAAPDAKLLLILRDPVERFRSSISRPGVVANGVTPVDQMRAFTLSRYAEPLARWQRHFPPGQLLTLVYESCAADPAGQLRRTYEFLGLDPDFLPSSLVQEVNKTSATKVVLPDDVVDRLRALMADDAAEVARLLPDLDLSPWRTLAGST